MEDNFMNIMILIQILKNSKNKLIIENIYYHMKIMINTSNILHRYSTY